MEDFNMILKDLRAKSGLTQEQLARASGISVFTIHKLEQKSTDPSWSTVQKLAVALGVPTDAFRQTKAEPKKRKKSD